MIERVRMKNWKSHHDTEIDFSEGVNALIGTMGSGKSSVMEAVVFGLFGTTPSHNSREVTLDDLIRRTPSEAKEAEIEVDFRIEGDSYSVKRKIVRDKGTERSELRKEGKMIEAPSTQEVTEQVEKLLGLDFKAFTRAVYSEQNNLDLFLNMRPGERKERIDELLKIDRFEDARKTVVKVENNMERELENRQEELGEMEEEIDEEEVEELEEEIEEMEEEKKKIEEELESIEKKLEQKEHDLEKLKEQKQKAEKLEKKMTKLETRKESAEEELEELEEKLAGIEDPGKELEEARKKKEELEETREAIKESEKERKFLKKDIEKLEEEKEELEEEAEKFEQMEEVEEKLEEVVEELEGIKQRGNSKHAERKNLRESVETLKETDGECPTCGQEMDDEHREEVLEQRKKRIRELKKEEKKLEEKLENRQDRKEELAEKKEKLLQFKSSEQKLEKKKEIIEEKREELEKLEKELEEFQEKFSPDRLEKVEQKIDDLEAVEEIEELEEKMNHLGEKLEETDEQLEELDFDEERLEKLREDFSDLKEKRTKFREKKKSVKKLFEEKKKRMDRLEQQLEKRQNLEEEVARLDSILDYVHEYKNGLKKTQVELRQTFVSRLNELMDNIWTQVYPYDDYYSLRLNAEEGYAIEVLDSENNWISAEAEVSGGERHSAALVMRLALTYTLSPKMEVLMLDEPTHNMDSSAVEKLAETLRQNSGELIEQMFIVTHDPALEAAATGKLYQLEKKDTETGLTEVREVE